LILESIHGPADVKALAPEQLQPLADEVRQRLIDVVSQTGGHIGAGLGVVELTVALCAAFDSPRDKIVWDVGHQGYPWKILTGRNNRLHTLRQQGGLSGFLRRDESEHDQFGAGHAGTALSAAYGMATARDLKHEAFEVVAVVGDGAMTCGLPYEALNNAGDSGRDIIVVLNDNGMSIAPNVGAISKYFGSIIASPIGVRMRERVKHVIERASHVIGGKKLVDFAGPKGWQKAAIGTGPRVKRGQVCRLIRPQEGWIPVGDVHIQQYPAPSLQVRGHVTLLSEPAVVQ